MPDWTYRTLVRPVVFRLPTRFGRGLLLHAIGGLSRMPGGRHVIEFMGHMLPARALRSRLAGTVINSPVGLAPGIDPDLVGLAGLCRFGFGFVGIGPVTLRPMPEAEVIREDREESIRFEPSTANPGLAAVVARLEQIPMPRPAVIVYLSPLAPGGEILAVIRGVRPHAAAFALSVLQADDDEEAWRGRVRRIVSEAGDVPVLMVVAADCPGSTMARCLEAVNAGVRGAIVGRAEEGHAARMGKCLLGGAEERTRQLRGLIGPDATLIAAAGIHAPGDAERLIEAGADLVAIDSGLVFTGPGLAKRCNELLLLSRRFPSLKRTGGVLREAWPWALMLGISLLVGGLMALVIAATRVVMPYDEAMSGLTRARIAGIGPRLLPFMTHDRVTLAGAMLGVGLLFSGLAWWGVRAGHHWTRLAVTLPASLGFLSFFSFLGFGYFDPLHAFVSGILFQFLVQTLVGRSGPLRMDGCPDRTNDAAWLRAQWGQLGFVIHGAALLVGGIVITLIGMTTVFVPEDLVFLELCAADLNAIPGLVPLIAHDRGTFGGMLMVAGLTMLLAAMWGIRRGASWVWWTMLTAGTTGYAVAIAVHHAVGYVDPRHLAPAWGGLVTLWLAALASRGYLCSRDVNPSGRSSDRPDALTT